LTLDSYNSKPTPNIKVKSGGQECPPHTGVDVGKYVLGFYQSLTLPSRWDIVYE